MNDKGKQKVEVWGFDDFDKALKTCPGNRPLGRKRVQRFLRMMIGGFFDGPNADPILFYTDKHGSERLFDGIHRCMAGRIYSSMTGKSVPVLTERGLGPETTKLRGSANQTIADQLVRLRKQSNAKGCASTASAIAQIFTGDNNIGSMDEYDAWTGLCPHGLSYSERLLSSQDYRLAPLVASFAVAYEVEPEAVERIVDSLLGRSDLVARSPARALQYRVAHRDAMNLLKDRGSMMRIVFNAILAESNGMKIERLTDSPKGQDHILKAYSSNKKLRGLMQVRSTVRTAPIEMSLVPEGSPLV